VKVKEIEAKTILRKHKKIDSWFVSRYGMNLYRGCTHNCVYCDGRSEKYNVDGDFGCEVKVKVNAIEVLRRELDPKRKKIPVQKEYIMLGGGVGDSYQPVEEKYKLGRKTLKLLYEKDFPVSILTKSTLVERDLDIIKKINEKNRAIVSFSFSSANDKIGSIFEPGVPPPSKRLETLKLFKKNGITTGMFLMPVIPFITDRPEIMNDTIAKAKESGVDFIIFSGMTLKDGRQKDYFMDVLKKNHPELITEYTQIYKNDPWGSPTNEYYESIHKTFSIIARRYKIPVRIPLYLFKDFLSENNLVIVILEQIDYMLKMLGGKSPYGFAAYSISKINRPLSSIKTELRKIKGVGPTTEKIILEILETKTCRYYEKLMALN
jgi:DNA repair photolyase